MNSKTNIQKELDNYFACARNQKCPPTMKTNLYNKIGLVSGTYSWFPQRLAIVGMSLVFILSVFLKISNNHQLQQDNLEEAQVELQIAMHYINQVSMKSLSAINTNGIKPAIIKPLARTYASL